MSKLDAILEGLTPAQREAVTHVEGPLLILAGPGSGKTRVVTHRIAHLLAQGIPGSHILALTFTNKAAEEMRRRVERLAPRHEVWLGTFHRFCAQLLRQYGRHVGLEPNFTIYDDDDALDALGDAVRQSGLPGSRAMTSRIMRTIRRAKSQAILPERFRGAGHDPFELAAERVYPAYQRALLRCNAVDFDDLLLHVVRLLVENPELRARLDDRYRFILVDEYQDTNLAQYAIARSLSIDWPNLAVTGDPDQSIYGWRGANLRNILEFERDYPNVRVVRLEQNYRSTARILRVAASLIAHNVRRKEKHLFTHNAPGTPVRLVLYPTGRHEASAIAAEIAAELRAGRRRASDFAVFYRVNALSRALETALRAEGVPYQLVHAVEFFQRREIRDVLGYLQLLNNPRDQVALLRVLNAPPRGIGKRTIERLADEALARGESLLETARRCGQIEGLSARAARPLGQFVELFDRLSAVAHRGVEEILGHVLELTGYRRRLEQSADEQDQQRLANIEELLTVARDFDEAHPGPGRLEEFLEETALTSDADGWQGDSDRVTLMTLHASKGLEFPVVYIVALEQGILPHQRSQRQVEQTGSQDPIEEERRLLFVGITRAQERLTLSLAHQRDFRGHRGRAAASPFLVELPRDELEVEDFGAPDLGEPTTVAGAVATDDWTPDRGAETAEAPEGFEPEPRWEADFDPLADDRRVEAAQLHVSNQPDATAPQVHLTTAARLAGLGARGGVSDPEAFVQGMVVIHPEYGLGRIIALGGSGRRRTATVRFVASPGEHRFVLCHSPLRPAGRENR